MKKFVLMFAVVASAAVANAQVPNTIDFTCAKAQSFVNQAGVIVFAHGSGRVETTLYSRTAAFSGDYETTHGEAGLPVPAIAPTKDNADCVVGYVIKESNWIDTHWKGSKNSRRYREFSEDLAKGSLIFLRRSYNPDTDVRAVRLSTHSYECRPGETRKAPVLVNGDWEIVSQTCVEQGYWADWK